MVAVNMPDDLKNPKLEMDSGSNEEISDQNLSNDASSKGGQISDDHSDSYSEADIANLKKVYSEADLVNLKKALNSEREARRANEKSLKEKAAQLEQVKDIDPEIHRQLLAAEAKRAELEAETAARVGAIEKSYAAQLAAAKEAEEAASIQVHELQKQYAFERAFHEAGGRGGQFTDLAYSKLSDKFKLEPDGSVAVVDKSGGYVVDDKGRRFDPAEYLKQYKSHELLGYAFQPERGAGSGLVPHPGTALANGADMHSLSTADLFAQAFGRRT